MEDLNGETAFMRTDAGFLELDPALSSNWFLMSLESLIKFLGTLGSILFQSQLPSFWMKMGSNGDLSSYRTPASEYAK